MKNSMQIVLFFGKNEAFNPGKIANLISEQLEDIGSPIILPMGAPADANVPILIFSQNSEINLTANFNNITITLLGEKIDKCNDLTTKIFGIFSDNKFVRIGNVINKVESSNIIETIKTKIECNDLLFEANDFKIAWLEDVDFMNTKINMWKNYFSDKTNTEDILCVYDFNTKIDENLEITKDFVIEFLDKCKENI